MNILAPRIFCLLTPSGEALLPSLLFLNHANKRWIVIPSIIPYARIYPLRMLNPYFPVGEPLRVRVNLRLPFGVLGGQLSSRAVQVVTVDRRYDLGCK